MGMNKNNQDDQWDFDFKEDSKKSEKVSELKNKRQKRLRASLNPVENSSLELERGSAGKRKSRTQRSREIYEDKLPSDEITVVYPAVATRLKAFFVDLFLCSLIGIFLYVAYDEELNIVKERVNLFVPYVLKDYMDILIIPFLVLVFSFYFYSIFTSLALRRSFGKVVYKLRIKDTSLEKAPYFSILFRNLILRPFSILSIVGVFLILMNKKRRALHDFLSWTILFHD